MPLKPGSSRSVVSENISEFHKGPTYAKTAAKFGKAKADKQAIAVALSTARRYGRKKQEGGPVEEGPSVNPMQTAEGFPFLQATKPIPTGDVISSLGQPLYQSGRSIVQGLMQPPAPAPIKTMEPPENVVPPHETLAGAGKELLHEMNPLRWFEQPPVQDIPPEAYKGKIPPNQPDWIEPVAAGLEAGSSFIGIPSAIKAGLSKAAIAFGAKIAAQQAGKQLPKLATHEAVDLALGHGFLDTSGFKKAGHQLGYMPGGVYTDPASGTAYYLKVGPTIDQVKNEQLASKIYNLAGVPTAEVNLTNIHGSPGIASKMIPDSHQLSQATIPYDQIKGLHDNFVVDAWLANHDAVGTGSENPLGNIMIQNGQAIRIDGGGALRYKGSGDLKKHFYDDADEINSMRDPNFSKRSAQVFGNISDEALRAGAQKVADVDPEELAKTIAKYGPDSEAEQQALLNKLLKRRQYIMDQFGVQPKGAAKPSPFEEVSTDMPPEWWAQAERDLQQLPIEDERMVGEKDFSQGSLPPVDTTPDAEFLEMHQAAKPKLNPKQLFKATQASKKLNSLQTSALLEEDVLGKKIAKNLATALHSGPDSPYKPFETATYLWDIADKISPHKAEAIFRALPEDSQKMIGRRIAALKQEIGSSPFDKIEGTGKYLTTKTASHPVPEHLWSDAVFTSQLKNAVDSIRGGMSKPQEITKPPKEMAGYLKTTVYPAKAAETLVDSYGSDTDKIANAMYRLAKDKPEFVDQVYKHLPDNMFADVNAEITELIQKHGDPWKSKTWVPKTIEDQHIFDAITPVKDWQNYVPEETNFDIPAFSSLTQQKKAESTGHNIKLLLWKGHSKEYDYPEEIKDFSAKKNWQGKTGFERANFLTHRKDVASAYGYKKTSYVARGRVYEVDFEDLYGQSGYFDVDKGVHRIIEAARAKDADMVLIHNITDWGQHNQSIKQTQYAVINQNILRAPHAKFDPTKLHLARPLLGLVGGGLLVYGSAEEEPKKFARGGHTPWNVRRSSHIQHNGGMIQSSIPGRTDKIPLNVKSGSYILPADVPSALGQGNTMAGGDILRNMLKKGPYGVRPMSAKPRALGLPKLGKPKRMRMPTVPMAPTMKFASGGESGNVPIIAAGGEWVVPPEIVNDIGGGNMDVGHRTLDKFVLDVRKRNIQTLKNLKPPKR